MKFVSAVIVLLIFTFSGDLLAQELYRWVEDNGMVHFTDSLHSIPENYRRRVEKRSISPSPEVPLPAPQSDAVTAETSTSRQPGVPFFRYGNQITVVGFINQNISVNLIVDPKAPITTLPPSIGSRLGINPGKSIPFRLPGVRGVLSGRLITIDSLRLGEIEMNDVEIVINEFASSEMGRLGMDLLGRFRVHLDYASNWMELAPGEGPYEGRTAEWWQERFRFYRELKQPYEKQLNRHREQLNTVQQYNSIEDEVGVAARMQQILADIRRYEGYVRIITQKIDDLERRASDAAVPRDLRE